MAAVLDTPPKQWRFRFGGYGVSQVPGWSAGNDDSGSGSGSMHDMDGDQNLQMGLFLEVFLEVNC